MVLVSLKHHVHLTLQVVTASELYLYFVRFGPLLGICDGYKTSQLTRILESYSQRRIRSGITG